MRLREGQGDFLLFVLYVRNTKSVLCHILPDKLLNEHIRLHSAIMQVQSMSRHRRQIRPIRLDIRIQRPKDLFRVINRVRAVSKTKRQVLRSIDYSDGVGEIGCWTAYGSLREELANRDRSFRGL